MSLCASFGRVPKAPGSSAGESGGAGAGSSAGEDCSHCAVSSGNHDDRRLPLADFVIFSLPLFRAVPVLAQLLFAMRPLVCLLMLLGALACSHATLAISLEDAARLYPSVSEEMQDTVVKLSIVYTRAASVHEDTPEEEVSLDPETPQWEVLFDQVSTSIALRAIDCSDDLKYILRSIRRVYRSMLLNRVDCIQICKGGIDVLRINLAGNSTGRSAFIEINSLRLRLTDLLSARHDSTSLIGLLRDWAPYVFALVGTLSTTKLFLEFCWPRRRQKSD